MQLFRNLVYAVCDAALATHARLILVPSALRFGDGGCIANNCESANVREQ
jgi:hypothetical protein